MRRTALTLPILALLSGAAWGCGTDVAGPSSSLIACLFVDPHALAVGEAVRVDGAGNQSLCLEAGDEPATFLYVPFFAATAPRPDEPRVELSVSVVGAGVTPGVTADVTSEARVETVPLDHDFHRRLRAREIEEFGPMLRPGGPPAQAAPGHAAARILPLQAPVVGDLVEYNVAISCSTEDLRPGRVMHVSDHAVVVAETAVMGALSPADYQHFAVTFDTLVQPVSTAHFGEATDIDGNGRVIIFFTPAVNALSPADGSSLVAGFFWSGDLFPAEATPRFQACPGGNQAEMFYVMVADPDGQWGPTEVTVEELRRNAIRVLGHEHQHLINAARRMYVNEAPMFERTWLNEGLSHMAEELLFFAVSGLPRGTNLTVATIQSTPGAVDAFNRYSADNFGNFRRYLLRPDTASLMGVDHLATRGATWSFVRYAADRSGRGDAAFLRDLVNSTRAGIDNLNEATGGAAFAWMRDWTVATFADDFVPGVAAEHTQPTWNMRDIYDGLFQTYPLRVAPLSPGATHAFRLQPGGAEFALFEVTAGGRATIHVESDGRAPPRGLRGSILRVR